MIKKINIDNKIFTSDEFIKDKYKFNIILQNLSSDNLELYSDEENYVVCRGRKDLPTWIWTRDGFDRSLLPEIQYLINLYLTDVEKNKFISKRELYDLLMKDGFDKLNDDYFEMGILICEKVKQPKKCDGYITIPSIDDIPILGNYFYNDCIEMHGVDQITLDQAYQKMQRLCDDNKVYIWKNEQGKIVSMASYTTINDQAKIGHAYTPVEERNKGYAANLIYMVTKEILNDGLLPLLYTDYNYVSSNRAYINAGYSINGILNNFSCSKNKVNIMK